MEKFDVIVRKMCVRATCGTKYAHSDELRKNEKNKHGEHSGVVPPPPSPPPPSPSPLSPGNNNPCTPVDMTLYPITDANQDLSKVMQKVGDV